MTDLLHPRENPDLSGHEHAEQEILDAWSSGRLHHAWLINGPKGIGKATLAYRFARFILAGGNAPAADEGDALFGADEIPASPTSLAIDPEHPVFRRVAANGHADLQVIERGMSDDGKRMQTVIPVDKIRAVGHTMSLTAGEGGWRVIIVDGAEEMNPNAANALLKVLEEPPPRALLLLITHAPGRLLPTIRSRCCQLRLSSLSPDTVDALLAKNRPDLSDDERKVLGRLSDGSIGRALDLADSGGVGLQRDLIGLMNSLPANAKKCTNLGERHPGAMALIHDHYAGLAHLHGGYSSVWLSIEGRAGADPKNTKALLAGSALTSRYHYRAV